MGGGRQKVLRQFEITRLAPAEAPEILDVQGNACAGQAAFNAGQEAAVRKFIRTALRDFTSGAARGGGTPSESNRAKGEPDEQRLEEVLAKLDKLTGLVRAKAEIKEVISLIRVAQSRRALGIEVELGSFHSLFVGNPGTGKTTFARIYAEALLALGALPAGSVVEVSRADLVAGYTGQTAIKTREALDRAEGGVLFIDEAYALVNGQNDSYGEEALAELIKAMEDRRGRIAVVLAGYSGEMQELVDVNPGLKSRIFSTIHFDDYSAEDLAVIAESMAVSRKFTMHPTLLPRIAERMAQAKEGADEREFGNAREARNLVDRMIRKHAVRVAAIANPSLSDLTELTQEDLA